MIGYYVHHHGLGHLNRARAINAELGPMVGLSSLPRPRDWVGSWIQLPRDDTASEPRDPTAHGLLHWVPERDQGLRDRMQEVASWIADIDPELMIVDISVEVTLLARLHGVPVISMLLPGDRRDTPHVVAHTVARTLIAPWPGATRGVVKVAPGVEGKVAPVGGMSRFDERIPVPRGEGRRRVLLMLGQGGHHVRPEDIDAARGELSDWEWTILEPGSTWVDDPWDELCAADVVVTHAGQNAIAEVAAARRPAVVIPQRRPFGEQDALAAALAVSHDWPAVVCSDVPRHGWRALLEEAAALDGDRWESWNDRQGAARVADIVRRELSAIP